MNQLPWPYFLLVVAIGLLVLEVFIPSGGVLGAISGIAFITSVIAAFVSGGLELGTYFLLGISILIPAMIYVSLLLWPKTPIGKRILNQPQSADQILPPALAERQRWLGRQATAVSPMLPSGAIRVDGQTMDAISDGVPIDKGTIVEVIAIRGNYLVVRPRRESDSPGEVGDPAGGESRLNEALNDVIQDPFDDSLS